MKRRVVFVGGPLCGKSEKVEVDDLSEFITIDRGNVLHTYRHVLRPVLGEKVTKVQHRYLFCGHRFKLPQWMRAEIKRRRREGHGE